MFKLKKVMVILVALLLILGICIQVQATDNPNLDLSNLLQQSNTTTNIATNTTSNTTTNTTQTNRVNTTGGSVVQPSTNSDSSSGNSLPQTGVTEDITVMFFIIVCAISAVYAYKKIRDYKG